MLKHLHIRNLAIIDELELDFSGGFSVLTGETGAGKSILIDAIGLVIGTRADAALVRAGQEKAEISASFAVAQSAATRDWLQERELADGAECIIRRVVYAEGRTRAFVNGTPVNAGDLRELGETLIEIFGQNESQGLLRTEAQRQLLDAYGRYDAALEAVAAAARQHAEIARSIERIQKGARHDPAQLDYLRFQLRELEALNLQDGEIERLENEHRQLAGAGRLIEEGGQAGDLLYGGETSVYDQLSGALTLLGGLTPLHAGFGEAQALCESARTLVREAADALRQLLDRLELNPDHLAELERRLAAIHDLARKHRIKASELLPRLQAMREELELLEGAAGNLDELERRRLAALAQYREAADRLHAERVKAAKKFGSSVTALVRTLGMAHAQFSVAVEPANAEPRTQGDDAVRFDFSANPGQPPRALAKVASGGELSRVSLAIQVAALRKTGAATMIFDEVDAGVGGGVAEIVGQKLRELGDRRQVLCVTHLPQVAAQGRSQFAIRKEVRGGQTYTRVQALDDKTRAAELARMLGGVEITDSTRAHAAELLSRAGGA